MEEDVTLVELKSGAMKTISPMEQLTSSAGNYLFKDNNTKTRTKCEICLKLTIKTPERCHWRRSGVFNVNFEHISQLALLFPLVTLHR